MGILLGYKRDADSRVWRLCGHDLSVGDLLDLHRDGELHLPGLQHQLRGHADQQHSPAGPGEEQELQDVQAAGRQEQPARGAFLEDQQLHRGVSQHQKEVQHRGGEHLR